MATSIPGDPFGEEKNPANKTAPPPEIVNKFHERADTDSSWAAIHHSLGVKHDQAAPGDHVHNGEGSLFIMEGVTITGSRGGNAALAALLTALAEYLGFTDGTTP
jgi:hypothetical protein